MSLASNSQIVAVISIIIELGSYNVRKKRFFALAVHCTDNLRSKYITSIN
jgi:hypothetical protein